MWNLDGEGWYDGIWRVAKRTRVCPVERESCLLAFGLVRTIHNLPGKPGVSSAFLN
jgi:hypothetical protein